MKKYTKGEPITSLDELVKQELVYWRDKITHRGWFMSWQIKMTFDALQKGNVIFKVIKVKEEI